MTDISMIDMDTWPLGVKANVLGGGMLVIWLCLLGRFYISRKYLDRVLSAFGRSPDVRFWERRFNQGLFYRSLLFGILAQFVFFSGFHIKRGEVSAEDIRDFPRDLKRVLLIDSVLMWASAALFAVLCVLMEIRSSA